VLLLISKTLLSLFILWREKVLKKKPQMIKLLKLGEGKLKKNSGYRSIVGGLCIAEQNNVNYLEIGTKRWKCQVLAQKKKRPSRGFFVC